jgi:hypothetical protein
MLFLNDYERDQLDEELPPVVHNLVHVRGPSRYVLVTFKSLQTIISNVTHFENNFLK